MDFFRIEWALKIFFLEKLYIYIEIRNLVEKYGEFMGFCLRYYDVRDFIIELVFSKYVWKG